MRAYTPNDMRNGDAFAINTLGMSGYSLMQNAAESVYGEICKLRELKNGVWGKSFVILCGKGNNGGDGYAVGKLACADGAKVVCIDVFGCEPGSDEAKRNRQEFLSAGGSIVSVCESDSDANGKEYVAKKQAEQLLLGADVIIEAIFGTGFDGDIKRQSPAGMCIEAANSANGIKVAIDCPSGVNSLTGRISEVTFKAHLTVTLSRAKPGLFSYPAKDFCGRIVVTDIRIPQAAYPNRPEFEISDWDFAANIIKPRQQNSHKGTFGRLLCLCGSKDMTGAAALCISGALRCGVGLVNAVAPEDVLDILKIKLNEPIFTNSENSIALEAALEKADAVVIGCGLSRSPVTDGLVYDIIKSFKKQIILDADGINAVSDNINVLEKAAVPPILTPHPLEFSRLTDLSVDRISSDRISAAKSFAHEHNCVVVLKGAASIISDGSFTVINTTGNSALAKGGSGDVLAGIIGALAAQGYSAIQAAAVGAYVHGLAAQRLSEKYSEFGVIPSDLPCEAGKILGELAVQ